MSARMNKWDARFAIHGARNRGELPDTWQRFDWLNAAAHEVRRALLGIDKRPIGDDFCARDFYPRLRRYILACRRYSLPRLP
jgi:hypothetical protein